MLIRLSTLAAVAIAFVACAPSTFVVPERPVRRPVVNRIGEASIRIRWPESFSSEPLAVYRGVDPSLIDHSSPLAIANGQSLVSTAADDPTVGEERRLYYELVPASGGASVIAAERRLPLECCDNFRDLGGYETNDGRTVRWNRL